MVKLSNVLVTKYSQPLSCSSEAVYLVRCLKGEFLTSEIKEYRKWFLDYEYNVFALVDYIHNIDPDFIPTNLKFEGF